MASVPLVGERDAKEKHDKFHPQKSQNKSKNLKSVPRRYYKHQSSQPSFDNKTFSQHQSIPVASDDSSSQPGEKNRHEPGQGNAIPGYVKFHNFVKISFDLRNRDEVRALKRKLASELDQVTSLMKRLEATQIQLSKTIDRNSVKMNSEVCSLEPTKPQSFRGSNVSMNESGNNYGVHGESVEKEKKTSKMNHTKLNAVDKDKLNPMEGNKKLKSNEIGNRFVSDKDLSRLFKGCANLLERLMKHKYGWVFNKPVDVKGLGLHDYYTIIKHPMDLGTVKARLSKNLYKSPVEFAEDARLTFNNAMSYNPKGQDVHVMAEVLSKIFEEKWTEIEAEYNFSRRPEMSHKTGFLPTPLPKTVPAALAQVRTPAAAPLSAARTPTIAPPASVHTPAPASSTPVCTSVPAPPPRPLEMRTLERAESMALPVDPKTGFTDLAHQGCTPAPQKPKAKDPNKRDMTYEEKQRLSMNLQELPSDKLDNVVQIIKKRIPVLSQQDDEIEVDIDSFDPETLWELDRFVTSYKKSLSKNKRKAEVAHQAAIEVGHNVHSTNVEQLIAEAPKETEAVEKIAATSSPIQGEKNGDNASESSASSGSSSDSGSSSSDSDHGSSGYGSDADN